MVLMCEARRVIQVAQNTFTREKRWWKTERQTGLSLIQRAANRARAISAKPRPVSPLSVM
jgi:hypothetical protein